MLRQNHLLIALSDAAKKRLFGHMDLVGLQQGQILYDSCETISHVYFPVDAIISLHHVMGSGDSAEVSVVGNEGLADISLFLGGDSTFTRAVVQSAGRAYRISGKLLQDEFDHQGELKILVLRYIQTLMIQMSQTSLCNRYHSILQQLCRCLLLSLDRLPGDQLMMTQKLISDRLGVRREGITEAAGILRRLGVIEYNRGHITVLDRNKLEHLSCGCYAIVNLDAGRLLPR